MGKIWLGPGICVCRRHLKPPCRSEETEMSLNDGHPWDGEGDLPWDTPDEESADAEVWRGDLHHG